MHVLSRSLVSDFLQPHGLGCQAPRSMGFSRQEYWSGLPCPPPEDLPNPGIKLRSPASQADSFLSEPPGKPYNSKSEVKVKSLSCVRLFETPWTIACQAPLSMGFSRQEYCSGLPCPPPGDLPNPGIKLRSPALQAGCLPSEPPGKPGKSQSQSLFKL